jgi:hypothetical protein
MTRTVVSGDQVGGLPRQDRPGQCRLTGGCDLHVAITMSGPLAWLWTRALGKGAAASLAPDLAGLVAAAEARHAAAATA